MRSGMLKEEYHHLRKSNMRYRHQLEERIAAVKRCITFKNPRLRAVLDIGTADGRMLEELAGEFRINKAVGLELNYDLVKHAGDILPLVGEACRLPFKHGSFDIIVLSAVIEHIEEPRKLLADCRVLLRDGGIVIITTPVPFFDRISSALGFESKDEHVSNYSKADLAALFEGTGFAGMYYERFLSMPYPANIGRLLDSVYRAARFDRLFMNQIASAKKIKR
ncbi:class I SAM-dependent methyltransferase [Candidatus Auribacterota bacterium]